MDIFVGSIPFKLRENQLREIFEKYGEVSSVRIIIDKITRQNKGFGFVTMPNELEAKHAMKELNGVELEGRNIKVYPATKSAEEAQSEKNQSTKKDYKKPKEKSDSPKRRFSYLSYDKKNNLNQKK